jgi:Holliday junction DNA helicase RuvA
MIGSLRGTVLERGADAEVLLEVHGVGYRVTVTPRTMAALDVGTETFLHIHHHIREDAQTLYGFLSRDERACFEAVLGAHRVGPALALAITGTHGPLELRRIVLDGDVTALTLVPGVGKQTAARLLLELKGRLAPGTDADAMAIAGSGVPSPTQAVAEALTGLGYSNEEIREALRDLTPGTDPSVLLRDALKVLAVRRA